MEHKRLAVQNIAGYDGTVLRQIPVLVLVEGIRAPDVVDDLGSRKRWITQKAC